LVCPAHQHFVEKHFNRLIVGDGIFVIVWHGSQPP
jgi:hypothetical protein